MNQVLEKRIHDHLETLVKAMNAAVVCDRLLSTRIITREEKNNIMAKATPEDKNRALIDVITGSAKPSAFSAFISALVTSNHQELADLINAIRHGMVPNSYEQLEKLGEGGFGAVYMIRDNSDGKIYAMKKLKMTAEAQLKCAQNEVKMLSELHHPRIVEYYGSIYDPSNNQCLIFMEYVAGGSLRGRLINQGPFDELTVIVYIKQILDGLTYLHSQIITHSDLKCDNLFLDKGEVKLGDFGLAVQKLVEDGQVRSVFFTGPKTGGTPFWMAPEVETKGVGRRTDLWSLGCTIVEMLTSHAPYVVKFQGDVAQFRTAQATLSYAPDEILGVHGSNVSKPMKDFLRSLLQREADQRPLDAAEARAQFNELFKP